MRQINTGAEVSDEANRHPGDKTSRQRSAHSPCVAPSDWCRTVPPAKSSAPQIDAYGTQSHAAIMHRRHAPSRRACTHNPSPTRPIRTISITVMGPTTSSPCRHPLKNTCMHACAGGCACAFIGARGDCAVPPGGRRPAVSPATTRGAVGFRDSGRGYGVVGARGWVYFFSCWARG